MKAAIRFIRSYEMYGDTYYEIVYQSYRIVTVDKNNLPKTAVNYLSGAKYVEKYDPVFKRTEKIFKNTGAI